MLASAGSSFERWSSVSFEKEAICSSGSSATASDETTAKPPALDTMATLPPFGRGSWVKALAKSKNSVRRRTRMMPAFLKAAS